MLSDLFYMGGVIFGKLSSFRISRTRLKCLSLGLFVLIKFVLFIVVLYENKGKSSPSEMWMRNFDIFVFLSSTFIFIFFVHCPSGFEVARKGGGLHK